MFRDIHLFISLNFGVVEISYAPRVCNKVAHALAAYGARHAVEREVWVDMIPRDVRDVAVTEFAAPS
jgi:hypothetical protein